ncbi:hypothetical protein PPL_10558 [Heterostelium album PN500]|uniref:EGF-like domain-containing protein n=1 Tax=Heterostelium pallidum (strain ATCC 26659 / Pp 5 / PN500) TaxID=670386 RepID=D3BRE8_HETP5|nr:hypothetical protein PPL_10558 [Heterostelium album PN500]EFA75980.1 hypothetical protein PPL_10558 [Heterostelium album PN500]|eukprot:XP_020428114.1 hypothetical protein PPL_10558 [Heterostelium album PN500]
MKISIKSTSLFINTLSKINVMLGGNNKSFSCCKHYYYLISLSFILLFFFSDFLVLTTGTTLSPSSHTEQNHQQLQQQQLDLDINNIDVNDDSSSSSDSFEFVPTLKPTSEITIISKDTINFTWVSDANYEHKPYYNASISFDNKNWLTFCYYSESNNCVFDSLVSDTTYHFKISDVNYDIPVDKFYSYKTQPDSTSRCILEDGDNACYGNGHCMGNQCICNDGWGGDLCQIKTFNKRRTQDVKPMTTQPIANITMAGMSYSIIVDSLQEYTSQNWKIGNRVEFSQLNWRYSVLEDEAVEIHSSDTIVRKRWLYQADLDDKPSLRQSARINVTFTQYVAIEGVTDNHVVTPPEGGEQCVDWSYYSLIEGDRITALSLIDAGGNMVYGQFPNRAEVDNVPRSVENRFTENKDDGSVNVSSRLPYFEMRALLDPDLNLLVTGGDYSRCRYPSKTRFTLMVTFGFSLGLLLAATSFCLMVKYQQSRIHSKNYHNFQDEEEEEEDVNANDNVEKVTVLNITDQNTNNHNKNV